MGRQSMAYLVEPTVKVVFGSCYRAEMLTSYSELVQGTSRQEHKACKVAEGKLSPASAAEESETMMAL